MKYSQRKAVMIMEEGQRVAELIVSHLDFQRSVAQTERYTIVYGSCVRSMMYGNETWPMKKGHESMLERTEI